MRVAHAARVRDWSNQGSAFNHHLLPHAFPHLLHFWQYLTKFSSRLEQYQFLPEQGMVSHLFAGGPCSQPNDAMRSLASWACVHHDTYHFRGSSTRNCAIIKRSELTAISSALRWFSVSRISGVIVLLADGVCFLSIRAMRTYGSSQSRNCNSSLPAFFAHHCRWWQWNRIQRISPSTSSWRA